MQIEYNELINSYFIDYDISIEDYLSFDDIKLKVKMPKQLIKLIDNPIIEDNNIYSFTMLDNENGFPSSYIQDKDLIGIECAINKINLIDYARNFIPLTALSLLKTGLAFSILLSRKLESEKSNEKFKIIFSFRISKYVDSVVRFHKIRENLISFVSSDFKDKPSIDGLLIINTGY